MKALKIALPIILILAILGGAYLYFYSGLNLSYDYYISAGDKAIEEQRLERAITCYSNALEQKDDDPQLIIKLADAYVQNGNYTKAEYTLAGGLNDMPDNVPLYIALSKVYVTQDKLLDAAKLLDGITNEYARTQLSDKRPAAPVISPESGEYDEFFTVNVSYGAGSTAYVSTDNDYPSKENPALETEIVTSYGTTSVYAVAVSEEGLVSALTHAEYTVANVIEDVTFTDPAIEDQVRTALDLASNISLTTEDLWVITSLYIPSDVKSLDDLRWFSKLPALVFESTAGLDLSQISMCTSLEELTVADCGLSTAQLEQIGQLTWLKSLDISSNQIVSLDPLSSLTSLISLKASNNSIYDLTPLSGLNELQSLNLGNNAVEDISPLWSLTKMQALDLRNNPLTDISNVSGMTQLTDFDISGCSVSDASALSKKTELVNLNCNNNNIASLDMLSESTKLESLYADNNGLTSIKFISKLTNLKRMAASGNLISEVPDLKNHTQLSVVDLSHNQITDVTGLGYMPQLNYLNLDYNNISDVSCLTTCYVLVEVNVFANPVLDTDMLTGMGVIVNAGLLPEQEAALAAASEEASEIAE